MEDADLYRKKLQFDENFSKLKCVLDEARQDSDNDPKEFCAKKIFKMGRFIRLYADLMKLLNAKLNEDFLEELDNIDYELSLKKNDGYVENLSSFLNQWNSFLTNIETKESDKLQESFQINDSIPEFVKSDFYLSQILPNKADNFEKNCLKDLHLDFIKNKKLVSNKSFMLFVMLRHFA